MKLSPQAIPNPHDPFKSPSWRWERARWLRDRGKYIRAGKDDEWTLLTKKYQILLEKAKDEIDHYKLSCKFPGIYFAHDMYEREETDFKWTIEALILAKTPFDQIAKKVCCSIDVVFWYEKLFFNVTDKLDSPYYIVNRVFGNSIHRGVTDRNYDLLWKLYGYMYGPMVLEFMFLSGNNPQHINRWDQVPTCVRDDTSLQIHRRANIAVRTMPLAFNHRVILETHTKLIEIEKLSGATGGSSDMVAAHVNACMTTLGKMFTALKNPNNEIPSLKYYDEQSAELRASEAFAVSLGIEPEGLQKQIGELKIPEPTNVK